MRVKFTTKLYCSKHTDIELNANTDSKIHYPDAFTTEAIHFIYPCRKCIDNFLDYKLAVEKTIKLLNNDL